MGWIKLYWFSFRNPWSTTSSISSNQPSSVHSSTSAGTPESNTSTAGDLFSKDTNRKRVLIFCQGMIAVHSCLSHHSHKTKSGTEYIPSLSKVLMQMYDSVLSQSYFCTWKYMVCMCAYNQTLYWSFSLSNQSNLVLCSATATTFCC